MQSDGTGYRLPTEAEWEYACRAGAHTEYCWGNDSASLGRYAVFAVDRAEKCGSRLPNAWGLFDVHGNVFEWCQDGYGTYKAEEVVDPIEVTGAPRVLPPPPRPPAASDRVDRGGGWNLSARSCRSADRYGFSPSFRHDGLGFRVALVQSPAEPSERSESK